MSILFNDSILISALSEDIVLQDTVHSIKKRNIYINNVYIYIYIYIIYIHCLYIYIYRERERERYRYTYVAIT